MKCYINGDICIRLLFLLTKLFKFRILFFLSLYEIFISFFYNNCKRIIFVNRFLDDLQEDILVSGSMQKSGVKHDKGM